ncbi:MAG: hypothetical protein ACKOXI_06655 [Candidatus Planktophila sp.]
MKRLLILIFITAFLPSSAVHAADCQEKACIQVYTQDGHIVIEGRKGSGPKSTKVVAPTPRAAVKPKATIKAPVTKRAIKPTVRKPRKRPAIKKSTSGTSLEDKLIESIPTAGISYQPSFSPLIQTPVYFWSDIPTVVTKKVEIVGEFVDVRLRPTFIWHFGDGDFFITRKVGAPYPDGEILHTYSKPGHYVIELVTRWDGQFTVDGVSAQIPGEITTVSLLPITVVAAPVRFMN